MVYQIKGWDESDPAAQKQLEIDRAMEKSDREEALMEPHKGLKRIRTREELLQSDMAQMLGISRKTYQLYEQGKLPIPSDKISRVSTLFDADIHELFCGTAYPSPRKAKMDYARIGIEALLSLFDGFSQAGMEMDEMKRIAMSYASGHQPKEKFDIEDLHTTIRLVTGDKYLPDPNAPECWAES